MTLKPFLAKFFPRSIWGSRRSSRRRSRGSGSGSGGGGIGGGVGGRFGRRGNNRGSETLLNYSGPGGPPTIGSLPSKKYRDPLASVDRDGWVDVPGDVYMGGKTMQAGGGRRVWVDGGYVEIDDGDGDVWGVDVELVEHVARPGVQRPPPVGRGEVRVDTEVTVKVSNADEVTI
jgi:hypothetical protein